MFRNLIIGVTAVVALALAQTHPSAVVHIYRYKLPIFKSTHPVVSCDTFPIVRIQNGRVYTMKISATQHTITVADAPTAVDLDAQPGKEYFVRVDYSPNAVFSGARPVLVPPEQGSQEIKSLKPLDEWYVEAATCGQP